MYYYNHLIYNGSMLYARKTWYDRLITIDLLQIFTQTTEIA